MNPVLVILIGIGCVILFVILMPFFSKIGEKIIKRWNESFNVTNDEEKEKEREERK